MRERVMLLLLVVAAALGCRTVAPQYRIIGYVFRDRANIPAIGAQKLTHINYAFAVVDPGGELTFKISSAPEDLMQLCALKAKNPKLKIILSVGGWGADNFSDAALTDESREKFAASVVSYINAFDLDGIDLDWEYPGQPGPGIKYRAEDKQNFTKLVRAIRCRLDELSDERRRTGVDRYTISIATSAGHYFRTTEMDRLHAYVDWFNVMSYDFYTDSEPMTGHHTALYARRSIGPKPVPSTDDFVRQHLAAGIPPNKIVVGAAFYGRGWTGVNDENDGFQQPYQKIVSYLPYSVIARQYLGQPGFTRYWDRRAHAPYLWNDQTKTLISYDDPQSLREKARFVRRHHLGGIMYWEHSHDPGEVLLTVLYDNLH